MSCDLTVLMTVYNGAEFLRPALESILNQTYRDFHFLIVDDASTDDGLDIVRSYGDDRIDLLCLDKNVGQSAALNIGLRHASTKWIARMDADDYSAPTRLEEQMRLLDSDDSIGILGTHAWTFFEDPANDDGEIVTPLDHAKIKHDLLSGSPLIHSSFIAMRTALLDAGAYTEHYRYAADVDLYDRLMDKCKAANLPSKLYGVRVHPGQGVHRPAAVNEIIDIFRNRLATDKYSAPDRIILRSGLARRQIILARKLGGQGRLVGMAQNLWRAWWAAPKTFAWYFPAIFVAYCLPMGVRGPLKGMLVRALTAVNSRSKGERNPILR